MCQCNNTTFDNMKLVPTTFLSLYLKFILTFCYQTLPFLSTLKQANLTKTHKQLLPNLPLDVVIVPLIVEPGFQPRDVLLLLIQPLLEAPQLLRMRLL